MERVVFVVPLDTRRHLRFSENLEALSSRYSDVYVILTDSRDKARWDQVPHRRVRCIVLADYASSEAIAIAIRNRVIPTFKKWVGLDVLLSHYAGTQYKYLITLDCEVRVSKPIDQEFVKALPSQFNFIGDHTTTDRRQIIAAKMWDPVLEDERPCDIDNYAWWSGLPLYDVSSLPGFLQHVGVSDRLKLAQTLRWEVFDHLVYQRYVFIKRLHGARFICLTHDLELPTGRSLEHPSTKATVWEASRQAGLVTLWAPESAKQEGAYILYHLDRCK